MKPRTIYLALPVAEPPAELPPPAQYMVLPAIEAATAVRSGRASSIYPAVYHDLVHWANAHGFQTSGPGRDIWINEIDDISQVDEQVFETQLPFTRPGAAPE
jgi:effector-binding domain-containing protein